MAHKDKHFTMRCPRYVLRKATVHDAVQLGIVHVAVWRSLYADIMPKEYLDSLYVQEYQILWQQIIEQQRDGNHMTMVAINEESGSIIGFASGGKPRTQLQDYASELYAVYILPTYKECGIRTRLMKRLVDWLIESNFTSLFSWVLQKDPTRIYYELLDGQMLPNTREVTFGEIRCIEIVYGWSDLPKLAKRLSS